MKKYLLSFFTFTALSLFGQPSIAQSFPDNDLLNDLKQYSQQQIECTQFACNSINQIKFNLSEKNITASFYVSSRISSFVELPFKQDEVKLYSLSLDNKPWYQIMSSDSAYHVVVPKGEHIITVKLHIKSHLLSLTKKFPNIEVSSGLSLDERNGASVITFKDVQSSNSHVNYSSNKKLENKFNQAENNFNVEKSTYPTEAFYQVSRTLYLNNSWKVVTQIKPLFETTKSTTLSIPLLKGENILNSDIKVENNKAIVNLSNQVLSWESNLPSVNQLEIPAVTTDSYSQVFSLQYSNLWKSSVTGKNPFNVQGDMTSWALWNGEHLTLDFKAPLVLEGKTLALDNLIVSYKKEHDTSFYHYSLTANTSLTGKMFFTLPNDYKIEQLIINNHSVNIDKNTIKIPVDLNFGTNSISFTISTEQSHTIFKSFPYVQFPETIYNTHYNLDSDDWILYSGGSDIHTEYILFSSLIFLSIVTFITKKVNPSLHVFTIVFILFGFLQNSITIMLLLPLLLCLIKFKDFIIQRFQHHKNPFEYNVYQFALIAFSIIFMFSFLVTLKLGLLDHPSSWTLYGTHLITWYNEIYSSQPIWYVQLDSTIYHVFMFVWAIFVSYHLMNISKLAFKAIFSFELWIKKQPPFVSPLDEVVTLQDEVVTLPQANNTIINKENL